MYDNLYKITQEMARCNGFEIKPIEDWPIVIESPMRVRIQDFNIDLLEEQVERLYKSAAPYELEEFINGDCKASEVIIKTYHVSHLDAFFASVYKGNLHSILAVDVHDSVYRVFEYNTGTEYMKCDVPSEALSILDDGRYLIIKSSEYEVGKEVQCINVEVDKGWITSTEATVLIKDDDNE